MRNVNLSPKGGAWLLPIIVLLVAFGPEVRTALVTLLGFVLDLGFIAGIVTATVIRGVLSRKG